jgi:hypothetical protein
MSIASFRFHDSSLRFRDRSLRFRDRRLLARRRAPGHECLGTLLRIRLDDLGHDLRGGRLDLDRLAPYRSLLADRCRLALRTALGSRLAFLVELDELVLADRDSGIVDRPSSTASAMPAA